MTGFQGQRIVITGAGGGVGQTLTAAFAALGGDIVACDTESADLTGPRITEAHHLDLQNKAAIANAALAILFRGIPSVVVLNAGWTRQETMAQMTPEGIINELNVNMTGSMLLTHAVLPDMRREPGNRSIVFVSSVNALAHHGNPTYSAAEAGMLAWMRALAVEEGAHGIRANAVVPGSIRIPVWDHRLQGDPGLLDRVKALYPLWRIVTTGEVANAITFLASSTASSITGATLNVDAGLSAGNLPFLDEIR